jgi:OOP family OmpA-OmpF porin
MKKITLAVLMAAGLVCGSTAFAGDDGWYILGGAGQATGKTDKSQLDTTLNGIGYTGFSSTYSEPAIYRLHAGYQIDKNLAVEGGYMSSGNANYNAVGGNVGGGAPFNLSASATIKAWSLVAVGTLPVTDQFGLLGKLGVANVTNKVTATASNGAVSASATTTGTKTALTYGVGAKYDFSNALFGRFDVDNISVGDATTSSRGSYWTLNLGYKL